MAEYCIMIMRCNISKHLPSECGVNFALSERRWLDWSLTHLTPINWVLHRRRLCEWITDHSHLIVVSTPYFVCFYICLCVCLCFYSPLKLAPLLTHQWYSIILYSVCVVNRLASHLSAFYSSHLPFAIEIVRVTF